MATRVIFFALALVALIPICRAQETAEPAEGSGSDAEHLAAIGERDNVDEAVDKALEWLATKQDIEQGFFAGPLKNTYTGLACMAFMAAGHVDGRSVYGENLRRGILYLARQAKANNGFLGADGGRMYGHGICALALCEAYGMLRRNEDNKEVREAIALALRVILDSQAANPAGSWRYMPESKDADLSVAAWQILVLRAAQNCGFDIPEDAVSRALEYVRKCYSKPHGFAYQGGGHGTPAMRAAGVVCMKILGADKEAADKEMIDSSAAILDTVDPAGGSHYFYQSYYLATAANVASEHHRNVFLPKLEAALLRLQQPNGEFAKHSGHDGGVYSTSFAVICLAVRYQYLPIYQE